MISNFSFQIPLQMKRNNISQLQISDYNYILPDGKIAKYPLQQRDTSKLLLYDDGQASTLSFGDLPQLLPEESLLLFNNTRVIHARLLFQKETGAQIEIFCLSPEHPADYVLNFQQRDGCSWHCMIGNAKRWKGETLQMQVPVESGVVVLKAEKVGTLEAICTTSATGAIRTNGATGTSGVPNTTGTTSKSETTGASPSTGINGNDTVVHFSWNNNDFTFSELLELAGKLPIPPYLNRPSEANDDETYQTVYSSSDGSVAAPTAGLHFTQELMGRLRDKGIQIAEMTLHVGAGTFKPVKSETIAGHEMHTEFISVPKVTIAQLLNHKGKVIVVGTTSMRTVESLYYIGRKLGNASGISGIVPVVKQWDAYDDAVEIAPGQALQNILDYLEATGQTQLVSSTQMMIVPGYEFHYPDAIITNFHQPQSTLLLLISAFVGEDWRKIYDYALENDFRFLSYGDSSLLWKKPIFG